jgi:hypothetical protein
MRGWSDLACCSTNLESIQSTDSVGLEPPQALRFAKG